jgi:hypothetical protein
MRIVAPKPALALPDSLPASAEPPQLDIHENGAGKPLSTATPIAARTHMRAPFPCRNMRDWQKDLGVVFAGAAS